MSLKHNVCIIIGVQMDVIEARVRKCIDESTIIDKKMRTRKFKYEKYIIPLSDNNPFEADEFVKVLRKSDFDKIGDVLKKAKNEKEQLKKEIKELTILLESQRNYIASIENSKDNEVKKSFRELIGIWSIKQFKI